MLHLPKTLFGHSGANRSCVEEYYYRPTSGWHVCMDFVFITLYLGVAALILWALEVQTVFECTMVIILTTIVLTGLFCFFFWSYPRSATFFSRWFHTIGYASIKYDILLIIMIYLVYAFLQDVTLKGG